MSIVIKISEIIDEHEHLPMTSLTLVCHSELRSFKIVHILWQSTFKTTSNTHIWTLW